MAISDKNEPNNQGGRQAPQGNPNNANPNTDQFNRENPPGQEPNLGSHTAGRFNGLRRSGNVDRTEGRPNEAIVALTEAKKIGLQSQDLTSDKFEILMFDRTQHRVGLPAILITKTFRLNAETFVVVRPLVLDSQDISVRPTVVQGPNGQRIEVKPQPNEVFNDRYWQRIVDFIRNRMGNNPKVQLAGQHLIPRDFDFSDTYAVQSILATAVNRCEDVEYKIYGEKPFSIQDYRSANERLTARIDYSGEPVHSITGQPIRADIVVSMSAEEIQHNNQPMDDYYQDDKEINSVACYVNLEYTPTQNQNIYQNQYSQAQQPEPPLSPTVIITAVNQGRSIKASTPELYFLSVSNAYRVTARTAWAGVFIPKVGRKGVDTRDIGALGYLTNEGKMIDTKSDSFDTPDFGELMEAMVRPRPTFLIDIDPGSENSLVESYLLDIAYGSPEIKARATQLVIEACGRLTGGAFNRHFQGDEMIVMPYTGQVHMGHYPSDDGERDIRDLDTLAMLNLTKGDMDQFYEWYRTFVNNSVPYEVNMDIRKNYDYQYLSRSLTYTGRGQRLLLGPKFIVALDKATVEAGVSVSVENTTEIMGGQRFQGNPLAAQYAVDQNAQPYNSGGSTNYQPGSPNMSGGRYF